MSEDTTPHDPTQPEVPASFSYDDVVVIANKATEDVLEAIGAGDDGSRDLANLLTNTILSRLQNPDITIAGVILENWDAEPLDPRPGTREETDDEVVARVIGWAQSR